jgi:hypothetical protein
MYTGEKGAIREQKSKGSQDRNLMQLSEQCLELVSVFQAFKKNHLRMYRKGRFNSLGLLVHSNLQ